MRSPRQLLVGTDHQTMHEVSAFLNKIVDCHCALHDFESVRKQFGPHASCVLVCVAGCPADIAPIIALVREVRLREWPVRTIVVAKDSVHGNAALATLDDYVLTRMSWPTDASDPANLQLLQQQIRLVRPINGSPNGTRSSSAELLARSVTVQTPSMERLIEPLALAADHDVTVLLTGPTGTGKTFLARLIHDHSERKNERMMVVPCGALASNLIESELFGHEKGAFTGADRAKVGKFQAVGAGTLLLDEIDTLTIEHQAKLLRVIETKAYEAVGSNETSVCRARIIVASNWDLEEAVGQGRFREDLFYRLNVLSIHLEPLVNRPEDIGPLARSMVVDFSTKFQKDLFTIDDEAMAALHAFPWPGNIRQLENVMQQAVLVSTGPELLLHHLPPSVRGHSSASRVVMPVSGSNGSLVNNRNQHERAIIESALRESHNCRSHAANALGISRATLYNKMKKLGIPKIRTF